MTDSNVIPLPQSEVTPATLLQRALDHAEYMDSVLIFSIDKDGEVFMTTSGMTVADACVASIRIQDWATQGVNRLDDIIENGPGDDGI